MNFLDVIVLIPVAWFAFRGFTKGFVTEIFTMAALALGVYCSLNFSEYIGDKFGINGAYAEVTTFIITFLAVVIIVFLLGKLIERLVDAVALGFVNRLLGAVLGILKIVVIFAALFYVIQTIDTKQILVKQDVKEKSLFFYPLEKIAEKIMKDRA